MKLSIVMPVYNEYHSVSECIRRVLSVPYDKELIVVDDASTDGTRALLKRIVAQHEGQIRLLLQPTNRGKGAALRVGLEHALGDVVVIQDADLEYDPREYARLVGPIEQKQADVVFGSRFLASEHRVLYFWHSLGNRILTTFSNVFTNLNLTDMETCYKVFRRSVIQNLVLEDDRFGFEPEVTAKLAKSPCVIYEVPISYHGRTYADGKKITWRDGFAALGHILRYNLRRRSEDCRKRPWHEIPDLVAPPVMPDHIEDTLGVLASARRYNAWMHDRIKRYLGRRVLEIGSGIGNFTGMLAGTGSASVVATDMSSSYLGRLRDRFEDAESVATEVWNLQQPANDVIRKAEADTAVCLNVLEHIEDDVAALEHVRSALAPAGRLILLVPARPWLYCSLDRNLGHFRRYRKSELERKVRQAGFQIEKTFSMNAVGMAGWYVSGRLMKRETLSSQHVKLFDALAPVLRPLDPVLTKLFGGLSLICVARRPVSDRTLPNRPGDRSSKVWPRETPPQGFVLPGRPAAEY